MIGLIAHVASVSYGNTSSDVHIKGGGMRFDMFERLGPVFFRSKVKTRHPVKGVAVIVRRSTPSGITSPFSVPTDITGLGQPCADPENQTFRSLDRHTRWATVHALTHPRAAQ